LRETNDFCRFSRRSFTLNQLVGHRVFKIGARWKVDRSPGLELSNPCTLCTRNTVGASDSRIFGLQELPVYVIRWVLVNFVQDDQDGRVAAKTSDQLQPIFCVLLLPAVKNDNI
jgi:hypothetical protein